MFFGDFPQDIVSNDSIQYLNIHGNAIKGPVSDRIGFLTNLKSLDISMNVLTGTLPDTITELTNMRYLTTSGNKFSEQQMLDLSGMKDLQDLAMKGNNLMGPLPESLAELSKMQLLDLDGNYLTGTIPTWFGLMYSLDHLLLNRNELSGTIPVELSNLKGLKVLLLDGNNFHGNTHDFCEAPIALTYFTADCYPGKDGSKAEVECRCCTLCCNDEDESCNDKAWTSNFDSKYQYGFVRQEYKFSLDQAPEGWQKKVHDETMAHVNSNSGN
jgi:hypothetical protein